MARQRLHRPGSKRRPKNGSVSSASLLRREREKAETRAMILAAAREMFTRDGYDRTTMRAIADRIGYTATAIYHHFADKDALMLELCNSDFRALGVALSTISQVTDPVERIRLMGRGYVRFALEHPEQFRFMFLIDRPDPGEIDHDPSTDAYHQLRSTVSEAIDAGRFRPELNNPELVAQMLWASVHGIAALHVALPESKQRHVALQSADLTATLSGEALLRGMLRNQS